MQELQQEIAKIREIIRNGQDFLVMGHKSVDGDAYGSSMALYFYLQSIGKTVEVVNELPITPLFHFLEVHENITKEIRGKRFDAIFICDCGNLRLVGQYPETYLDIFRNTPVISIDHHNRNSMFGTYNLVDTGASSTCELVFDLIEGISSPSEVSLHSISTPPPTPLLKGGGDSVILSGSDESRTNHSTSDKISPTPLYQGGSINLPSPSRRRVGGEGWEGSGGWGGEIPAQVATLLLFGIIRDTNCFKNSIRPHTFEVTSKLIALQAEYDKVIFHSYKSEKLHYLQLYGHVLENLVSLKWGTIVGGIITDDLFKRYNIPESELGPQLINEVLSSIEGADFAFLIKDTASGEKKLSFRARRSGFDVSRIARHFGGGGHIQSAGAYTSKSTEEILHVIEEMEVKI